MRRCFVILMIVLLPFQSAWAAVAAYCGHEGGTQIEHLGHHAHPHLGPAAGHDHDADAVAGERPAGSDFECDHCHGGCAVMPVVTAAFLPPLAALHPATAVEKALRTLAQAPPERPQWARLA